MSEDDRQNGAGQHDATGPNVCDPPRVPRVACTSCRRRKLRCDKNTPHCGSCYRYRHQCVYEVSRRIGITRSRRKGYVSSLQQRLAQIEISLLNQEQGNQQEPLQTGPETPVSIGSDLGPEMMAQDLVRELDQIYFQKVHQSMPMLHRERYLAAVELELGLQPPVYLRHAVLAMAASASTKYSSLQERFYRSSREALEFVELNDLHLDTVSVEQAQTWILIATFEFMQMHFHRSWMSTGRAVRLVQMMGLHCMDNVEPALYPLLLPEPKDWTEREERRRTFWMAFCLDRYASIGHGWPMTIDDKDIFTRLPAPDELFQSNTEFNSLFLNDAMTANGAASLSPFAALVAVTKLCGQRSTNLRRSDPAGVDEEIAGGFWQKSSLYDSMLIRTFLVPDHLKMPSPKWDPNLVFLNMVTHSSTIRVHQEAIARADKGCLDRHTILESEQERLEAAMSIASIMRANCHVDLSTMNPFTSFCLYVAATALARIENFQLDEHQKNSLQFLLTAMNHLREVNPLTGAFLSDFEDEFPGLTANISSLAVGSGTERVSTFLDTTRFFTYHEGLVQDDLPVESAELKQDKPEDLLPQRDSSPTLSKPASGVSREMDLTSAGRGSFSSQEYLDPAEQQHFLEGSNGNDVHTMPLAADEQESGFFGGMFWLPRIT